MEFFELVKVRRSIRLFQPKPVEEEKIKKILEAANLAPSAGNLQAYTILVVKNKKIKEKLYQAALNQEAIYLAPVILIFFANPKKSSLKYGQRGENLYCLQDATIAASYAQLAAANLGLGSVWIGAYDDEKVKKILNAPNDFIPVAILPLGYPGENPQNPGRRKIEDLVKWEKF